MARYIDADKFAEAICSLPAIDENTANAMIFLLHEQPTADVVEVKHGHWERGWDNGDIYAYCTACKRRMNYHCYGYAYCSLCGAKMDGRSETNAE